MVLSSLILNLGSPLGKGPLGLKKCGLHIGIAKLLPKMLVGLTPKARELSSFNRKLRILGKNSLFGIEISLVRWKRI